MSEPATYQPILTLDEELAVLLGSDGLTHNVDFQSRRRPPIWEPERRLMLAILYDAINCFQRNLLGQPAKARVLFEEAERWIMADDTDWLFSFTNICEHLDLDPHYLRKRLLRWKNKRLSRQVDAALWQRSRSTAMCAEIP